MRHLTLLFALTGCIENGVSKLPDDSLQPADDSPAPAGPRMVVSPLSLDFGSPPLGQPEARAFTVENTGDAPLTLGPAQLDGASFTLPEPLPAALEPGERAELSVLFDAATTSPMRGTLTISGDDPENPDDTVSLAGDAWLGVLALSPNAVDFGEQPIGATATAEITATNTGDGPLSLDALALGGAADFAVVDPGGFDAPTTLDAGASSRILLSYTPSDAGADQGSLALGGVEVPLSGAARPEPVCTPFDDFASWSIGGSGNWTATGILTENRSGYYASIAYLPDQGQAAHFALQVDTAWRGGLNDFAGLVFGVANPDEYWVVRWEDPNNDYGRFSPPGAIDLSWCSYGSCTRILQETTFDLVWPADGSFVTWGMDLDNGQLTVVWNGTTVVNQAVPELVGVGPGPVGLYSNDNDGGVVYDNFCVLVDP